MKNQYRNYMQVVNGQAQGNAKFFSNYAGDPGAGMGQMNPFGTTLTFRVVNASNATGTYTIFGWEVFGDVANAGGSAFVTVTNTQTSAAQVNRSTVGGSFRITGCKLKVSDTDQFDQVVNVIRKSSAGPYSLNPITPSDYENPLNQNNKLIIIPPDRFNTTIDGQMYVQGNIIGGCTMTFTFTLGGRVNVSAVFDGGAAVSASGLQYPSGILPTIISPAAESGVASTIPMFGRTASLNPGVAGGQGMGIASSAARPGTAGASNYRR